MNARNESDALYSLTGEPALLSAWSSWGGAIECGVSDQTWPADVLRCESDSLVENFATAGMKQGDVVGLMVCNSAAFPTALMALLRLGCNPALIYAASLKAEVDRAAFELGMDYVVHDFADGVSQLASNSYPVVGTTNAAGSGITVLSMPGAPRTPAVDAAGVILHSTSGTYGSSKFCVRNQRAAVAEGRNYVESIAPYAKARVRVTTPLSHAFAYGFGLISAILTDSTLVVEPMFNPRQLLRKENECPSDILAVVPPMARMLTQLCDPEALANFARHVFYAGAPCPDDVAEQFERAFGTPLYAVYGTTETGAISTTFTAARPNAGVGTALCNVAISIEPSGRFRVLGEGTGEIRIESTSMMQQYVTRHGIDELPLPTGDIGFFGDDGNLHIVGRVKDIINLGGMKVDPREVELVLTAHEHVSDAVVYPGIRQDGTEFVQAALQLHQPLVDLAHIKSHCVKQLDAFKVPLQFHVVPKIPRTPSGKCLKVKCPDFPAQLLVP